MGLFRELDDKEIQEMRDWARENYKPFEPINGVWHPEVQAECTRINAEKGSKFAV